MAVNVPKLLQRSEYLAVEGGRIVLRPKTGNAAASDSWLKDNRNALLNELVAITGRQAFVYYGYTTGSYGKHIKGGVTLQLINIQTGESAGITYNAKLTRDRDTQYGKKGELLPKGRFNAGGSRAFLNFWQSTGLKKPSRASGYYDCMGKLKELVFTGEVVKGRLTKESFKPLDISFEQIRTCCVDMINTRQAPDNYLTITRQSPDSGLTRMPDKESATGHIIRGQKPISSACVPRCVIKNKVIKKRVITGVESSYSVTNESEIQNSALRIKTPKEQSIDEWTAEYISASSGS